MTTGKTIALTRWAFIGKVMSLLFDMLSRLVITFSQGVGDDKSEHQRSRNHLSELRWTGIGEFNTDDHYIYYCGQESLRRNGVAIMVNESLKCSTWMQS